MVYVASQLDLRAQGAASILRRLWNRENDNGVTNLSTADLSRKIEKLRQNGRVALTTDSKQGLVAWYAPSAEAKESVATSNLKIWGQRIEKYVTQSVKSIPGAVFELPIDGRKTGLKAFITDWSPFPAACAVAIHPTHALADSIGNRANAPTGEYVRHPLTGDLLPVWTAEWVKPEFGTGTVIVNPAHSRVDLEFARRVGLPVRFGLAPVEPTTDPQSWAEPPVVDSGIAVRTGIADGEPASKARGMYLERLMAANRAQVFTDHVLGLLRIATSPNARDFAPWKDGVENNWSFEPAVEQILQGPLQPGSIFVTSNQSLGDLVLCRAFHIDLFDADIDEPQVITVGNFNWQGAADTPRRVSEIAAVVTAKNEEVASVKKQNVEQVERFLENHEVLCGQSAEIEATQPGKRVSGIVSQLAQGQFSIAFSDLYKIQRDMRKNPASLSDADRRDYFAAAYALTGTDVPSSYDLMAALNSILN